jgi:hypothetical protein
MIVAAATCDCAVPMADSRWMIALAVFVVVVVPGIVTLVARRRRRATVAGGQTSASSAVGPTTETSLGCAMNGGSPSS